MLSLANRVHTSPGPASSWRCDRANTSYLGSEVQLRQDDLPQVLCPASSKGYKLPQEEMWPHKQHSPQKEAEVDESVVCVTIQAVH